MFYQFASFLKNLQRFTCLQMVYRKNSNGCFNVEMSVAYLKKQTEGKQIGV